MALLRSNRRVPATQSQRINHDPLDRTEPLGLRSKNSHWLAARHPQPVLTSVVGEGRNVLTRKDPEPETLRALHRMVVPHMQMQAEPLKSPEIATEWLATAPLFLTVHESAALFRIDDVTVTRAIAAGEFPAVKIRRRYVIPTAAIKRIIEEVIKSGRCVDLADWTRSWALETGAPLPAWTR